MSTTTHKFDLPARERFLALLAVGYNVKQAAAAAGTSRQTVARWAARGRTPDASTDHKAFAQRLDQARAEAAELKAEEERVSTSRRFTASSCLRTIAARLEVADCSIMSAQYPSGPC